MSVSPATSEEILEALHVFHHGNDLRIRETMLQIERGAFPAENILVHRQHAVITGAILMQRLPGGVAMLWPPISTLADPMVEDALIQEAIRRAGSVRFLHTFLYSQDFSLHESALTRNGFRHVTRVWEMHREASPTPAPIADSPIRLVPEPETTADLHAILMRSHEDSLDCPELHGLRSAEEVVQGYREVSPDRNRWFLAYEQDQPLGVAILGPKHLIFLGVIPEHRGRGLGRRILQQAIQKVPGSLNLTVDARNYHAYRLYRSEGFYLVDSYEFFLHDG